MDTYSLPVEHKKTKLSEMFVMKERANPAKPGRTLSVMWDERNPLVPDFVNRYSYIVRFTEQGGRAGNHYHKKKHELYFALCGEFTVILEDIVTKEREEIRLKAGDNTFLYVRPEIAHVVVSDSDADILLVVAGAPEVTTDEFKYDV